MPINAQLISTKYAPKGLSGYSNSNNTQGLSGTSGYTITEEDSKIPFIADATEEDIVEKFNLLVRYLLEKEYIFLTSPS